MSGRNDQGSPILNITLWIVQVLLALVFLFAGGTKLVLPIAEIAKAVGLPALFLRFIGACEVLGAIGLVLPGLTRIKPGLTVMATVGLVIIMVGATLIALFEMGIASALIPLMICLLVIFVAYGRWRLAPLRRSASV